MPVQPGEKLRKVTPKAERTKTLKVPPEHADPLTPTLPHEVVTKLPPVNGKSSGGFSINDFLNKDMLHDGKLSDIEKEVARFQAATKAVFDPTDIELKAILRPEQIPLLIRAKAFSAKYETDPNKPALMRDVVIPSFLKLSVSGAESGKTGIGRKNLVEVLRAFLVNRPETGLSDQQRKLEKLLG